MRLTSMELNRLVRIYKDPQRYIERRTETMEINYPFYRTHVRQQFTLPTNHEGQNDARAVYVPLGNFSKSRLPDLTVLGPGSSLLPSLTRTERVEVITSLLSRLWRDEYFDSMNPAERETALPLWDFVEQTMSKVVESPLGRAAWHVHNLRKVFDHIANLRAKSTDPLGKEIRKSSAEAHGDVPSKARPEVIAEEVNSESSQVALCLQSAAQRLLDSPDFWRQLLRVSRFTFLFAIMEATPGGVYVIQIKYSEQFNSLKAGSRSRFRFNSLLSWLAISPTSVLVLANERKARGRSKSRNSRNHRL